MIRNQNILIERGEFRLNYIRVAAKKQSLTLWRDWWGENKPSNLGSLNEWRLPKIPRPK